MQDKRRSSGARQDSFILEKLIDNILKHKKVTTSVEIVDKTYSFKKITNRASVVILSECLDKLSILCVITQEKIDPQWLAPLTYKPLERKMAAKEEGYDLFTYTNKKKLAKDLSFLIMLLTDVVDDVHYSGDISRLMNSLDVYSKECTEEKGLLSEYANNKALLKKLSHDMRKSGSRNREIFNKISDKAYELHEKYEETLAYGNVEYKYVDKWENSRTYLSQFLNKQAEDGYENTISTYNTKKELEDRINKEISNYIEVVMTDMQQEIESWSVRYDEDVDQLEKNMYELRVGKEKMEIEFASLSKSYAERQDEIEKWVELREKLRQEAEEERKRENAAAKIQAWWRGVMVRKCLGPYRKKKKGKGKGKGKDKKGGKKKK